MENNSSGSGQMPGIGSSVVSDTEELMAYKNIRYLPEFTDTTERYDAYGSMGFGFAGDTFYLFQKELSGYLVKSCQLVTYNPDTGEEKLIYDDTDRDGRMVAATLLKDGSAMVLSICEPGYRLSRVEPDGKEVFVREYADNLDILPDPGFVADSRGRCCLQVQEELMLFDEEGRALGKIDLSGKHVTRMVCSGSGTVYLYEGGTGQIIPVEFDAGSLGDPFSLPVRRVCMIAGADHADFLISDETTVYQYDCEDRQLTPLFDLQDSQIPDANNVDTIGEMSDGRLFLFLNNRRDTTEMAVLTPTPLAECPVKKVVTIGTLGAGTPLLEDVAAFNRRNEEFTVSILNYCIGGRGYEDAEAALKLDLSVGKGPDICDLSEFIRPEDFLGSGCLEDLSGYIENSSQFGKSDFFEQALAVYTYEDQLMAIPKYFFLSTILGKSDVVGETAGWDMEDVKAVVQKHPDVLIFDKYPSSYMLDICARNMLDEFVDFDSGRAFFDTAEYIAFLDFLNALPDNFTEREQNECWSLGDKWMREGRALLSCRKIYGIDDLQQLEYRLGDKYTFIGYPAPDKTPDYIIEGTAAYAISSSSQNKEGAWKFIEWSHSVQGKEKFATILRGGFPTRTDVFEQELRAAMEAADGQEERGFVVDGRMVYYRAITSEEADLLYSLIESAKPERIFGQTILEIMEEEAVWLFDGSKSAEEVAEVTQNRVQLYLDEM